MKPALAWDDERLAIQAAVSAYTRDALEDPAARRAAGAFDRSRWEGLASLGVLAVAEPGAEGGARELAAAYEALGASVFPGPLVASLVALALLPEAERDGIADGRCIVAVGRPPLLAWAPIAQRFLALEPGRAFIGEPQGSVEPVETLAGEPWGRVTLTERQVLGDPEPSLALPRIGLAALLCGAGRRLLQDAVEHARTRRQFGSPIGEFQAVAHPLAEVAIGLSAAEGLMRLAAFSLDTASAEAATLAHAAHASARGAALEAVSTAHQTFGAVGITLEGPAFLRSRRIRQWASWPIPARAASGLVALAEGRSA